MMRGMAVPTIVWSSAASSIASTRPAIVSQRRRRGSAGRVVACIGSRAPFGIGTTRGGARTPHGAAAAGRAASRRAAGSDGDGGGWLGGALGGLGERVERRGHPRAVVARGVERADDGGEALAPRDHELLDGGQPARRGHEPGDAAVVGIFLAAHVASPTRRSTSWETADG